MSTHALTQQRESSAVAVAVTIAVTNKKSRSWHELNHKSCEWPIVSIIVKYSIVLGRLVVPSTLATSIIGSSQ